MAHLSDAKNRLEVQITPVAAFHDNYIWLLERGNHAVVVDPGDAEPVLRILAQGPRKLEAILLTHHHPDHVGGVADLVAAYRPKVFGPATSPFAGIDVRLREGDRVHVLGVEFSVLEVPGHTLDHIAYWCSELEALFCGDTLFACGCGRLFEGTAAQMFNSLNKITQLPDSTRIYCAHEYTSANIRFALSVEPANEDLVQRGAACASARSRGEPTVPSTLRLEKATNPFLRCAQDGVREALVRHRPGTAGDGAALFAALRAWKDVF
ncbi:MAG TPA: hydroxyacylglutathione hydrolase [Burkholderiaceae bacterium]|nr:hydroxyacylglutathione hydrolase [Burkholderiaceae bacterium]